MKGGIKGQLEGCNEKHHPGKIAGFDRCQQTAQRCRTTLTKRTQGTMWAVGKTALPETNSSPVRHNKAGDDGLWRPEVNTKSSLMVRVLRAGRDRRVWHVWRGMSKNLGDPGTSCKTQEQVGITNERRWRRRVNQARGVRSTHNTQRMNKTFTGGRS